MAKDQCDKSHAEALKLARIVVQFHESNAEYEPEVVRQIAQALIDASTPSHALQNAAPQASSTQDSTRTGDDIGPSARHPTEKETGGAPAVAAPVQESWEGHGNHESNFTLSTIEQKTGETPSHYQQQAAELEAMAAREGSQRAKNAMNAAARDIRQLDRELAAAEDRYKSAVHGRSEFRTALKTARQEGAGSPAGPAQNGEPAVLSSSTASPQRRSECPYCASDNEAIRSTYYDQTCEGCVKRMG